MKKLDQMLFRMYAGYRSFRDSERGDTNFVSMLLIIGIVVVLAGAFMTFGNSAMTTITSKVNTWITNNINP